MNEDTPKIDPPNTEKTTAPREMPGLSPREAARLGIWSDHIPRDGVRYRPSYSRT
jgi:hypothetical protein